MTRRKKFIPTDNDYEILENAVTIGLTSEQICGVFGMTDKVFQGLRKRDSKWEDIWQNGKLRRHTLVVGKLFDKIKEGHAASIFFYLKTQLGWRETNHTEISISEDKKKILEDIQKSIFPKFDQGRL